MSDEWWTLRSLLFLNFKVFKNTILVFALFPLFPVPMFQMDVEYIVSSVTIFLLTVAFHVSLVISHLVPWFVFMLPDISKLLFRMIIISICVAGTTDKSYEFKDRGCEVLENFVLKYPGNFEFSSCKCWENPFSNVHYGNVRRLLLLISGLES